MIRSMKRADVTNVVSLTFVSPFLSLMLSFDIVIPPWCHEDVGVVVGERASSSATCTRLRLPYLVVGQSWVSESQFLVTNLNTSGRERSFKADLLVYTNRKFQRLKCIQGVENLQKMQQVFQLTRTAFNLLPSVPLVNHVSCFLDKEYNIYIFF